MDTIISHEIQKPVDLEQVMRRADVWRGQSQQAVPVETLSSGYPALDGVLLNGGWPLKGLVEVCQQGFSQQEWLLLTPALKNIDGLIVLLNPPLIPFAQGLITSGVDLERLRIIRIEKKADFLASFVEVTRTGACGALLAWEPQHMLSYTELRKCLLSCNEGEGIYTLFRSAATQQQSSPATLRMVASIQANIISVNIFKQRGILQSDVVTKIDLPEDYHSILPFHLLDLYDIDGSVLRPKPKAPVVPFRWGHK